MKNKKTLLVLAIAALVALLAPASLAEEAAGEIAVGPKYVNTEGNLNRASEFRRDESSGVLRAWYDVNLDGESFLELDLDYENSYEQDHSFYWRAGDDLRVEADFNRFWHYLPNDPLTNLNATDPEGKIVRSDNLDPFGVYGVRFEDGRASLTYQPFEARQWAIEVHARQMKRSGGKQNLSTGHCMTCHIVGQAKALAEQAQDFGATLAYREQSWGVEADVTVRSFEDDADQISREFERALHPVFKAPVFDNRVQIGVGAAEVLPVGTTVGHDRLMATLRTYWNSDTDFIDAVGSYMTTESDTTGLSVDYLSLRGRWRHRFGEATDFILQGRFEDISSDDIFVDVLEFVAPAGPTAGLTYEGAYGAGGAFGDRGFVADFTRRSALDRSTYTLEGDVVWRYGDRRRQRLKVGLRGRSIDRENFVVSNDGDTQTDEYRLRVRADGRFAGAWRYRGELLWAVADNTFKSVNGAVRGVGARTNPTGAPVGGPWSSQQYFELYRTRFGDLTNVPSDTKRLSGNLTWTPGARTSINFHGRYTDQENDETDVGDWTRTAYGYGAALWFAPTERLYGIVTGDLIREDQEAYVTPPLMDG